MSRFIDAEALKRDLIDNRSFYPAIVKSAIENAPTVDVVPRSEVELYEKAYESLSKLYDKDTKELSNQIAKLIVELDQAMQEVVREIIAEFKDLVLNYVQDRDLLLVAFKNAVEYAEAELKKKYIGEKK